MADDEKVLGVLNRFAKRKAALLLLKFHQTHDKHREEDITRFLLLAGLDVWQKTGNVRFAMNRIKSRYVDETIKLDRELKREPQPLKHLPVDDDDDDDEMPGGKPGKIKVWIRGCENWRASASGRTQSHAGSWPNGGGNSLPKRQQPRPRPRLLKGRCDEPSSACSIPVGRWAAACSVDGNAATAGGA